MKRKTKNGFTLVELLAVIVILAIILVIAVPKVMDVINDSKKATLESTAKMIASSAEKQKVQNTVLGKGDAITCDSVVKINNLDYEDCDIDFDGNTAKVTIKGKGKFDGLYVCNGTKTSAVATDEECELICSAQEAYVKSVNVTRPYVVNYDECMDYLRPIMVDNYSEEELQSVCKNEVLYIETFNNYIRGLIDDEGYTKEELIENNVVSSDSVWESNITVGDYDSCVSYISNWLEQMGAPEEEMAFVPEFCTGESVEASFSDIVQRWIDNGEFTEQELLENNVIGEDSVFVDIKLGNQTSCVNYTKEVYVDVLEHTEYELQSICSGKDNIVTTMDFVIRDGYVSERDLLENNIIEASIEEEKVCVPNYTEDAVTYITSLYNDSNVRSKFGLIKDNTVDQNIRYVGQFVQNYIWFNDELWRIIGVFNVETYNGSVERRVKIVRDEPLKDEEGNKIDMSWDSSAYNVNDGKGINEWSQSDLQTMLNTYYIGDYSASCKYCNLWYQATCTNSCDNMVKKIGNNFIYMIESVVWNTGALERSNLTPLEAYNAERANVTGKICTQGDEYCNDTVTRTTEWKGKVGLIYPSDYGYAGASLCTRIADYTCQISNWLGGRYWWSLSPVADSSSATGVFQIDNGWSGQVSAYSSGGVRPTLYLDEYVEIVDGDGSKNNPYKIISNESLPN